MVANIVTDDFVICSRETVRPCEDGNYKCTVRREMDGLRDSRDDRHTKNPRKHDDEARSRRPGLTFVYRTLKKS